MPARLPPAQAVLFGAIAGVVASLAFTLIHGLLISQIWFMLVPMLVAGALCGLCLSLGYALLVDEGSSAGWLGYNLLYLLLMFLLGPLSLLLYEPVITIPALVASPNGAPAELVRQVMPLAIIYTLVMALIITALYGRQWAHFVVVLLACAVLVLLLGLNIALLGLVFLAPGWVWMMLELLGLITALAVVYALAYLVLARAWQGRTAVSGGPSRDAA